MQGDCYSTSIFCWPEQRKVERDGRKGLSMRDARDLERAKKKKGDISWKSGKEQ